MYKVNICGNKGVNGAGIIFSGTLNIYGGQIKNNEAESFGGGIATGAAQNCILQNVKICNNTAGDYAGGLYWSNGNLVMSDVEISNNIVSNSTARYQAGGVALMQGTISVSGAITISGNQYNGSPNNLCNTNANPRNPGKLFIAGTLDEQSVIGLTHKTAPTEAAPDPVEVASGNNHTISPADWSRFFSDDDTYEILLDKTNNRLLLSYPGSCDLFTLSTSGATLSPEFKASDTEYTSTVANSVDEVGITATLASTASGADIKIKINDGAETPMENGVPKTVDLVEGENTIVIIVTSGEMSKAYTIKITKEEAPAGFTVTLNGNGGSAGTNLTSYVPGSEVELPKDWMRTGYDFAGWYDNEDCTGTAVTKISATDTGDKEYWAKWEPSSYTISYDLDGGTVTGNPTEYTIESSAITLINPTKTGYSFGGWSGTDLTGNNNMSVTIAAGSTGDREYTAHWTAADYTVTLNGNGGQGGTSLISYAHGRGAILPTDWTRTGYTFAGWYEKADCTGTAVTIIPADATGNKEYWAGWTPISYSITYVLDGGNVSGNPTSYTIESSAITLNNPTREGYTFTGWSGTDLTGNNHMSVTIASGSTGHRTYTAHWKLAGYTVTLHTHSGTLVSAVDPTCTTAGNKEHYTCTCGKLFSDSSCTNEITDRGAVVLDALGHHFEGEPYIVSTTQHWRKCSRCSVTEQKEDHTFDADDKCTVCGYSRAVDPGHTHSGTLIGATEPTCTLPGNIAYYSCSSCGKLFSDSSCTVEITEQETEIEALGHDFAMQKDQSEHWQQCSRCSLEQSRAPHVYDNDTDTECNVCGYVRTLPGHTHSGTLVAAKPATCTEDGNEAYFICSCGKWFSDSACTNEITDHASVTIGKLGHNFVGEYLFDANGHWKVCSRCNTAQTAENHVFDDNNDTTCNKCGYQRTIGTHTHSVERTVAATEPTCTAEGNKTYYICSCGKWFSDSACTKEVTAQDVTIPAKGHTAVTDPAKAATCTETGLSEGSHCSVCGHVIKAQTVTAALGHDYSGNYHYDAGGHWKVCSRCGAANAKQRHNYDNDIDTKCNDCGWVRTISDSGQDEQPAPTPTPEPPVPPTPQPPSPTNPPEQPQPTEKPDDPGTVPGTPDNSQPESTGTPEPTEKPSETGKEQQPEGDGEQTVPAAVDNGKIAISGEPVATGNVEGMTDTRTVLKLGNGAVIVTVVCAEQEYTAGVADTLAVANAVLTPEQIPRGVNEAFLGIIPDKGLLPGGERDTLFILCKRLLCNALLYPFFGVFGSQRLCAATDETLPVQRAERDKFVCVFPEVLAFDFVAFCPDQRNAVLVSFGGFYGFVNVGL